MNSHKFIVLTILLISPIASAELIEDSKLNLRLRNFYYNHDNRNGYNSPSKTEEWGQGFILDFQSGYSNTPIAFGVDILAMSAIRLDSGGKYNKANRSRNPGTIFPLQHNGKAVNSFATLGVTAKLKYNHTELRHGTLQPIQPVILYNDGRILPQTFHGTQIVSNEIDRLSLVIGHIDKAKGRTASGYSNLSVLGGYSPRLASHNITATPARRSNSFIYAGANYRLLPNLKAQYQIGQLKNFYRQHFFGLVHSLNTPYGMIETELRYFNSKSHGKNSQLAGRQAGYTTRGWYNTDNPTGRTLGEVDNRLYGGMLTYRKNSFYIGLGYQQLRGNSDFPWLDQGNGTSRYNFTPGLIANYSRAGERIRILKTGFNFSGVGLLGLTLDTMYYTGDNVRWSKGGNTEWERNIILSYAIQSGPLKNIKFTWLSGLYRTSLAGIRDQDENRISIDYSIAIF